MRIWLILAAMAASLALDPLASANEPDNTAQTTKQEEQPPPKEDATVRAVFSLLEDPRSAGNGPERADRKALHAYYQEHVEHPIWLGHDGGLNARAKAILAELEKADDWGLSSKDFVLPKRVSGFIKSSRPRSDLSPEEMGEVEVAVSLLALKYARHARGGRIPEPATQLSSYLDRKPQLLEPSVVMDALAKNQAPDAYLRSLHPQHAQFKKLREKLLALRNGGAQEQKPEDIKLPESGAILRLGRTHPDVALLRKRLSIPAKENAKAGAEETDREQSVERTERSALNPNEMFDQELEDAVLAFQKENNLYADGLVGRGTRRVLNGAGGGALTEEVLLANMEEWRWMPEDLGEIYITVNIPEFKIRVIKNGLVVHEESAIVGKINNQTPVFSDEMETVVLHPSWGVPNSIKVKEIWPSLARGGSVLQRQGLRIKKNGRIINPNTIDWAYADIRKYDVYQPPGSRNVLGVVKFLFPNKHQVYMHDTPSKHLFGKTVRTYSHGCMRIKNPVRLAEIVLAQDKNWSARQVHDLIDQGPDNNQIKLDKKIPVHITYFTAVIDQDGSLRRLKDIYGHEKRIKLALAGKFSQIDRGRNHLAPVRYSRNRYSYQPMSMNEIFQNVFGGF